MDDLQQTLEEYKTQLEQVWLLPALKVSPAVRPAGTQVQAKACCPYYLVLLQVEGLLLSEPDNQEYAEIYRSLTEAIELTEELLKETEPDAEPSSAQGDIIPTLFTA